MCVTVPAIWICGAHTQMTIKYNIDIILCVIDAVMTLSLVIFAIASDYMCSRVLAAGALLTQLSV